MQKNQVSKQKKKAQTCCDHDHSSHSSVIQKTEEISSSLETSAQDTNNLIDGKPISHPSLNFEDWEKEMRIARLRDEVERKYSCYYSLCILRLVTGAISLNWSTFVPLLAILSRFLYSQSLQRLTNILYKLDFLYQCGVFIFSLLLPRLGATYMGGFGIERSVFQSFSHILILFAIINLAIDNYFINCGNELHRNLKEMDILRDYTDGTKDRCGWLFFFVCAGIVLFVFAGIFLFNLINNFNLAPIIKQYTRQIKHSIFNNDL